MRNKQTHQQVSNTNRTATVDSLIGDIRALIEETRSVVAVTVNAGLTLLDWRVPDKAIVSALPRQLRLRLENREA